MKTTSRAIILHSLFGPVGQTRSVMESFILQFNRTTEEERTIAWQKMEA
jgi:hypothetical protein